MALSYPIEKYTHEFITNKVFKNQTIESVFNLLYRPEQSQFIQNIFTQRKDTDIKFSLQTLSFPKPPLSKNTFPKVTKYSYSLVHPVEKKVLFGPSKLNIDDEYNIIFESEHKLLCEVTTKLSGFMLMDTFISRTLYIYEEVGGNVSLCVKYDIEFVKANPFKAIVEKNGYEENEDIIKRIILGEMEKILIAPSPKTPETKNEHEVKEEEEDKTEVDYCLYYYTF